MSRKPCLSDTLIRARLPTGNDDENDSVTDARPGSSTLHMLEDLEMEIRGLEELFTSTNDLYPDSEEEGTFEWEEESIKRLF